MKPKTLSKKWKQHLVGQDHAIEKILPYLNRFHANLHMPNNTVGNFFLVGPTGTGKTKTPETLAQILHGSDKSTLKVSCETFQMDHEVAKLIGSPPGYLGHKETVALLAQSRLNAVASDKSNLSILIFDEIEKASDSLWRLILTILDKAELRLGDNSITNFENTIVFLTSNLAADKMMSMMERRLGFESKAILTTEEFTSDKFIAKLKKIGTKAVEKGFSPEFFNRLDEVIVYQPLTDAAITKIADLELSHMIAHIGGRLKDDKFFVQYGTDVLDHFGALGTNPKYGARFLKRLIQQQVWNPLCELYLADNLPPGSFVKLLARNGQIEWDIEEPVLVPDSSESVDEAVVE